MGQFVTLPAAGSEVYVDLVDLGVSGGQGFIQGTTLYRESGGLLVPLSYGAGAVDSGTQRKTLASDDPAVVHLGNLITEFQGAVEQLQQLVTNTSDDSSDLFGTTDAARAASSAADAGLLPLTKLLGFLLESNLAANATPSGITYTRVKSAATTNATSLKATAGNIYDIELFNTSAAEKYLKLYNKASAPTVGTDTPVRTIPLPAGGGYSKHYRLGRPFTTGIAYAITGSKADNNTTAVAVDDVTGEIGWL